MHNVTGPEFAELTAFLTVAEERSFRRAAKRLRMSPSALSRTIRMLEERLGVRLLNRTTRSVATTEAGETLRDRLHPAIADIEGATRDLGAFQDRPKGLVRVNLPSVAARLAIEPVLGDFFAAYPDVRLDLVIDNNLTDVVREGFDAGVRVGKDIHQDMVAVRLTSDLCMAVVGSPAYFERHPPPLSPPEIATHKCVTYRSDDTGALFPWLFDAPEDSREIEVTSALTVNDTDLLLSAALQGAGLAFLAETFVEAHVAAGRLVRVLEDWSRPFPGFFLYYPSKSRMPAALRAFIDFVKLPSAGRVSP